VQSPDVIDAQQQTEVEMITTTLKALRTKCACFEGYNELVRSLQGKPFSAEDKELETYIRFAYKEPISLATIVESNGLDDALWAMRACKQTPEMIRAERLYAVWCARQVQHLMTDPRSVNALGVADRHANGEATDMELAAARDASRVASRDAARAAAWDAVWVAAWVAARAAAWDAVWVAARDAARDAQKSMFIEVFCSADAPCVDAMRREIAVI
jgi:hypothetical protein